VPLTTAGGDWAEDIAEAIGAMADGMSESGQNLSAGMNALPAVYEAMGESLQRAAETLEGKVSTTVDEGLVIKEEVERGAEAWSGR
jgi:hypothetical protein